MSESPAWHEIKRLQAENERLRAALVQFVAACDTAPPVSFIHEIGMAREVAREALDLPVHLPAKKSSD